MRQGMKRFSRAVAETPTARILCGPSRRMTWSCWLSFVRHTSGKLLLASDRITKPDDGQSSAGDRAHTQRLVGGRR
jgi:hypothetical protein